MIDSTASACSSSESYPKLPHEVKVALLPRILVLPNDNARRVLPKIKGICFRPGAFAEQPGF
jgi:hypothetical protein